MGFLDKIKSSISERLSASSYNQTIVVDLSGSSNREPSKYDLLSSEDKKLYNTFYDKYYDAAQRWYEKYEDGTSDAESVFYDTFNYKKRITALEKAIRAYDNFFNNFSKHGKSGEIFFELEFPDVNATYIPQDFCKDYPLDIENVNCCKWLRQYYIDHKEEVCEVIKMEEIESEYGTYEAYEEAMQYDKHIDEVCSKVLSIIKKNDGILQKDIYKEFDPVDVNFVKKYLKELADTSKIMRTKSGSTYSLHYIKPSRK